MPTSTTQITLPSPAPGTARTLLVHRYGTPGARPKAYIQAALHADEIPGLLVAQHLLLELEKAQAQGRIRGEVLVVPVANPIGLDQNLNGRVQGRYDLENSVNFNRDFPDLAEAAADRLRGKLGPDPGQNVARIRAALAETLAELPAAGETAALKRSILALALDADWVLDLHCAGEALQHLYGSRFQREDVVLLGAELQARAVLLDEGPGGRPFDDACCSPWWKLRKALAAAEGEVPLACFAATVELRGQADVTDALAAADAAALLRFLQRRGVLAGDAGPEPVPACRATPLEGLEWLTAPVAGVVVWTRDLGECVAAGDVVAEIVEPLGEPLGAARTPVRTTTSGLLFGRTMGRLVRPGQRIGKVAGAEPLSSRQRGKLLAD
jgi:hypothetical protein